jgi:hypothetical protein
VILVFGGAAALGFVKRKIPQHAPTLAYAALGATCIAVLLFTFTGRPIFAPTPPQPVTSENIEQNIKGWAENLGMSIGPGGEPDSAFAYTLRSTTGDPATVFKSNKEKPGYLQFKAQINVSPEHQTAFAKMSQPQVDRVLQQLSLEIGQANLGCTFVTMTAVDNNSHKFPVAAVLQRGILISDLSESYFAGTFDQLTRGVALVRSFVQLAVPDADQPKTASK